MKLFRFLLLGVLLSLACDPLFTLGPAAQNAPNFSRSNDMDADESENHVKKLTEVDELGHIEGKKVTTVNLPGLMPEGIYSQVESGLSFDEDGRNRFSKEDFVVGDGFVLGRNTRHKLLIRANLSQPSSITLTTPDGQMIRSHPLGLSLLDTQSGKSVLIAEIKDVNAEVIPPNQVVFRDALDGVLADLRYTQTKAGVEQDVIVRSVLPSPADFGLNPATTRLEFWTEFDEPPAHTKVSSLIQSVGNPTKRAEMAFPDLIDDRVDFGGFVIGAGRAFAASSGAANQTPLVENLGRGTRNSMMQQGAFMSVYKRWEKIEGRHFLIESLEFLRAQATIQADPATVIVAPGGARREARFERQIPSPKSRLAPSESQAIRVASTYKPSGLVMDYYITSTAADVTFKKGETYHITGPVHLSGRTVIQDGAVLKYAAGASLIISGTLDCPRGRAILTSELDGSVGAPVAPVGTPHTFASPALVLEGRDKNTLIENLEFRYASTAVLDLDDEGKTRVRNCVFFKCVATLIGQTGKRQTAGNTILSPDESDQIMPPAPVPSGKSKQSLPRRIGKAESSDVGNEMATAMPISIGASFNGDIDYAGDADFFVFTIATSTSIDCYTTGTTDTYGQLLDSSGNIITYNDDSPAPNFRIQYSIPAGTYYIAVRHYLPNATGSYTLSLTGVSNGSADLHGNSAVTAYPVSSSTSLSASIDFPGDEDWFVLTVSSAGALQTFSIGSTDTYGYILDSSQNVLAYSDDVNGVNFNSTANVVAGTYYIRVRHYSPAGTGDYGLSILFTTSQQTPSAPTGLAATAGQGRMTLTWTPVSGATGYTVKRSTTGAPGSYVAVVSASSSPVDDTGLADATHYLYVVSASNLGGTGPDSLVAGATTAPAAPANLQATYNGGLISLTWTPPVGAYQYSIQRSTSGGSFSTIATPFVSGFSLPYLDSTVSPGASYVYSVAALSISSAMGPAAVSGTVVMQPPPPTGVVVSPNGSPGQLQVVWNTAAGATSYSVKRSTTGGAPYTTVVNGITALSYTDTGISGGTSYCYVVTASNGTGTSGYSSQACGVPTSNASPTANAQTVSVSEDSRWALR